MNCKPGDLAYCIRVLDPRLEENVGRIVTVLSISDYLEGDMAPFWNVEACAPGLLVFNGQSFVRVTRGMIRDSNLRPIAGPDRSEILGNTILNPLELALGITAKAWV
jgi:hypothetical protein